MRRSPFLLLVPLALAVSCTDKDDSGAATDGTDGTADGADGTADGADGTVDLTPLKEALAANYAEIVLASYADSVSTAQTLDAALEAFTAAPSTASLVTAREAWLASREPYLQTEVYRFYDGPIDNPDDGPEGLLNAWPLDENYIDYTVDDAEAGIINSSTTIDAETLVSLNEDGGEANVSTGYHAIEFLLWGQDLDDDGPGARPYTDYAVDGSSTVQNPVRRATYLRTAGDLLLVHLTQVHDAWAPGADYRTAFEADPDGALEKILTGMIVLSGFETGGERLQAALDSGDQEDEHSCFSDNTHRDMIQDIQGVQNVWLGSYTAVDGSTVTGTGVKDLVEAVDAELATRLDDQISQSLSLANDLQVPFDQEIAPGNTEGNARVQALVQSLRDQEEILFEVFEAFGLSVEIPE